jgi:hypothetical protein
MKAVNVTLSISGSRTNIMGFQGPPGPSSVSDAVFELFDNVDPTKKVAFQVSGVSSGTTRTVSIPNASGIIALTSDLAAYAPLAGATFTGGITLSKTLLVQGVATFDNAVNHSGFNWAIGADGSASFGAGSFTVGIDGSLTTATGVTAKGALSFDNGSITSGGGGSMSVAGGKLTIDELGNLVAASVSGDGSGLTNVNANYASSAGTAGSANSANYASSAGTASIASTATVSGRVAGGPVIRTIATPADGSTITLACASADYHAVTIAGNRTIALSGDTNGQTIALFATQDSTGDRTLAWPTGIRWREGQNGLPNPWPGSTTEFRLTRLASGSYVGERRSQMVHRWNARNALTFIPHPAYWTQDRAGSTAFTTAGQFIGRWFDVTRQWYWLAAADSNRATGNTVSGQWFAVFDGSDDWYTLTDVSTAFNLVNFSGTGFSMHLHYQYSGTPASGSWAWIFSSTAGGFLLGKQDAAANLHSGSNSISGAGNLAQRTSTTITNAYRSLTWLYDPVRSMEWIQDGITEQRVSLVGTTAAIASGTLRLGSTGGGAQTWAGRIGPIVMNHGIDSGREIFETHRAFAARLI